MVPPPPGFTVQGSPACSDAQRRWLNEESGRPAQERQRASLTHPCQLEARKTSLLLCLVTGEARLSAQEVNSVGQLKGGESKRRSGGCLNVHACLDALVSRLLPQRSPSRTEPPGHGTNIPIWCALETAQKPRQEETGLQGAGALRWGPGVGVHGVLCYTQGSLRSLRLSLGKGRGQEDNTVDSWLGDKYVEQEALEIPNRAPYIQLGA